MQIQFEGSKALPLYKCLYSLTDTGDVFVVKCFIWKKHLTIQQICGEMTKLEATRDQ